jgi:hypothetical protein
MLYYQWFVKNMKFVNIFNGRYDLLGNTGPLQKAVLNIVFSYPNIVT